ncbi:hypothetical protein ACIPIN_23365 [Pseudomonas sp. NPDC087697]|uniref:hypothetical protein n=1 Tax=Pseudomonas sp. NPDC087697 TaxID=3364447 RepID=UPI0037FA3313
MKKLGFPETPDFLPATRRLPTQEETQAFQEAGAAAFAKNEKNELDANTRWEAHQKKTAGCARNKARFTTQGLRVRQELQPP